MLSAFGYPAVTCCVLKIELLCIPGCNIVAQAVAQTWPSVFNIMQYPKMLHEMFDQFQI